jgi:phosphoserine phosphatase
VNGGGDGARAAGIALFDLDYTLLGGDATWEWIHFLIGQGALDVLRTKPSSVLRRLPRRHARHP